MGIHGGYFRQSVVFVLIKMKIWYFEVESKCQKVSKNQENVLLNAISW